MQDALGGAFPFLVFLADRDQLTGERQLGFRNVQRPGKPVAQVKARLGDIAAALVQAGQFGADLGRLGHQSGLLHRELRRPILAIGQQLLGGREFRGDL